MASRTRITVKLIYVISIYQLGVSAIPISSNSYQHVERSPFKKDTNYPFSNQNFEGALISSIPAAKHINNDRDFKINIVQPYANGMKTVYVINNLRRSYDSDVENDAEYRDEGDTLKSSANDSSALKTDSNPQFGDRIESRRIIQSFDKKTKDQSESQYRSSKIAIGNEIQNHQHDNFGKYHNNGSLQSIESESEVLHESGHEPVVSQGHEESKNKHDLRQPLSLNVKSITNSDNEIPVTDAGNEKMLITQSDTTQNDTERHKTTYFDLDNENDHSYSSTTESYAEDEETTTKGENEKEANNYLHHADDSNTAFDIYSDIAEIGKLLLGYQNNNNDSSYDADKISHIGKTSFSEVKTNHTTYDVKIDLSNRTKHFSDIHRYSPHINSSQKDFKERANSSKSSLQRTTGSFKYIVKSTTEKHFVIDDATKRQEYHRGRLNSHYKSNNTFEESKSLDITNKSVLSNITNEESGVESITEPGSKDFVTQQWLRVQPSGSPNNKRRRQFFRSKSLENKTQNLTDSKIDKVVKLKETNDVDNTTETITLSSETEQLTTKSSHDFDNNISQSNLSKNATKNIDGDNSEQDRLSVQKNKEIKVGLVDQIVNNSNDEESLFDVDESSYYNHDREISSLDSVRHSGSVRPIVPTKETTISYDFPERGSRKFKSTKFETISTFTTDSQTSKIHAQSTHHQTYNNNPRVLSGNEIERSKISQNNGLSKPYRGSIKFDIKNYDWYDYNDESGESLEQNSYPRQFMYMYMAPNGTDVSQNGYLKKVNNRKVFVVHGFYKYIAPDGTPIFVSYVADETGFHPQENKVTDSNLNTLEDENSKTHDRVANVESVKMQEVQNEESPILDDDENKESEDLIEEI